MKGTRSYSTISIVRMSTNAIWQHISLQKKNGRSVSLVISDNLEKHKKAIRRKVLSSVTVKRGRTLIKTSKRRRSVCNLLDDEIDISFTWFC